MKRWKDLASEQRMDIIEQRLKNREHNDILRPNYEPNYRGEREMLFQDKVVVVAIV